MVRVSIFTTGTGFDSINCSSELVPRISNMARKKPYFLLSIDVEGDNVWSRPRDVTCRNAGFLQRFQDLCERFRLKPTYLTNYEMAMDPVFQAFGRDVLQRGAGEIGMHLHAWNSPPIKPLTSDDYHFQPYLTEYPEDVMERKITYLTDLLEETFQTKMTSHRAGRWGFNDTYARILIKRGFLVDCSVTPHISWRSHLGDPSKNGGNDYTGFPDRPYFIDPQDVRKQGTSRLLEVPVTVLQRKRSAFHRVVEKFSPGNPMKRAVNLLWPPFSMLSLRKGRLSHLVRILGQCLEEDRPYAEFMTHSSHLMPGGGPAFVTARDIEKVYASLEELFASTEEAFLGATLSEYYSLWDASTGDEQQRKQVPM